MSKKYEGIFDELEQRIQKSLASVQPKAAETADGGMKELHERLDAFTAMLGPEGPIAKAIAELKSDQNTINEAVEKSLDRLENVEKSGAKPHSVPGDNTGTQAVEKSAVGVNTEWDAMLRHMSRGGKVRLTSN